MYKTDNNVNFINCRNHQFILKWYIKEWIYLYNKQIEAINSFWQSCTQKNTINKRHLENKNELFQETNTYLPTIYWML